MDTLRIKALLLAVKYKSLSKAAEEFSYTPSALSHSVDSLEKELGVKLLKRSHVGVELTEEGALLLDSLAAVVEAEHALYQKASVIQNEKQNLLRIGTYSSISVNLMPKILTGFRDLYPEISVSITVGNRISSWLEEDLADVVFGVENEGDCWLPVVKDPYVAVVPDTFFAGRKTVNCEELYPYSFIVTENLAVGRMVDLSQFKEQIVLHSDDDMSAVSLVQEGIGVTILPGLVLKNRIKGIRAIKLKPDLHRTLGLSYRKDQPVGSAVLKFVRYLQNR